MQTIARILVLFLVLAAPAAIAQEFSSLEERMSSDDFSAAGLERLSAEELARLNDWLRANWPATAAASPYPAQADSRVAAPVERNLAQHGGIGKNFLPISAF